MNAKYIDSFLGANTSMGFVSRFDQICDNENLKRIYVIKAGAGTGKSTMMKKIAENFFERGETVERVHCSSDPDSIDAVIVEAKKFAILDGTPPHAVEPKYPGARETIVNFYPCWNEDGLEVNFEAIKLLVNKYSEYHKKACGFITVASALLKENMRVIKDSINYSKVDKYIRNILNREVKKSNNTKGKETVRFFSAITPKGVKLYNVTFEAMCDKSYVIEDDVGAVSNLILGGIKDGAISRGYDVICGYCVMSPYEKIEHVIIPQLKLCFVTSNKYHNIKLSIPSRCVKANRFTDLHKVYEKKQYISFNKKAAKQFVNEAINNMKYAKMHHDSLEEYYIKQVDFNRVNTLKDDLLEKLNKKDF